MSLSSALGAVQSWMSNLYAYATVPITDAHHPSNVQLRNENLSYIHTTAPKVWEDLHTIFHSVDWESESKYPLLLASFRSDDEFIHHLYLFFSRTEDVNKAKIAARFDHYLQAYLNNRVPSKYLSDYLKTRMVMLQEYLSSSPQDYNNQLELRKAVDDLANVVLYLKSLDPFKDRISLEDCCLRLAVEGTQCQGRAVYYHAPSILDDLERYRA